MKPVDITTNYLNFSKKERTGVVLLLTGIILVVLLPYLWLVNQPVTPKKNINSNSIKEQLSSLSISEKTPSGKEYQETQNRSTNYFTKDQPIARSSGKLEVFPFDPNNLSFSDWQKLGLPKKTIQTIENYLLKGGRFYKPEDLKKIYGFSYSNYQRLVPYVNIPALENGKTLISNHFSKQSSFKKKEHPTTITPIDINTADSTSFISLPGIGSKLANRILHFRQKLGGFYSISQIAETYGLSDSTFQIIKPYLKLHNHYPLTQTLDINVANALTLKQHPYIGYKLANAIVQYRQQHGAFKTAKELENIALVTPQLLEKITPYLKVH